MREERYRDGTLAEYVAVEARNLTPLPGDVDFTVGAALVMPALTAWQVNRQRLHGAGGSSRSFCCGLLGFRSLRSLDREQVGWSGAAAHKRKRPRLG